MGFTYDEASKNYRHISKSVTLKQQMGPYTFRPGNAISEQPFCDPWITPEKYGGHNPAPPKSALAQARAVATAAGMKPPMAYPGDLTPGIPLQMQVRKADRRKTCLAVALSFFLSFFLSVCLYGDLNGFACRLPQRNKRCRVGYKKRKKFRRRCILIAENHPLFHLRKNLLYAGHREEEKRQGELVYHPTLTPQPQPQL